jgi:hypothetical protein
LLLSSTELGPRGLLLKSNLLRLAFQKQAARFAFDSEDEISMNPKIVAIILFIPSKFFEQMVQKLIQTLIAIKNVSECPFLHRNNLKNISLSQVSICSAACFWCGLLSNLVG